MTERHYNGDYMNQYDEMERRAGIDFFVVGVWVGVVGAGVGFWYWVGRWCGVW